MKTINRLRNYLLCFVVFAAALGIFHGNVLADNADFGGVSFVISYRAYGSGHGDEYGGGEQLRGIKCASEPKPFVIQYGDETITIPHKETYVYDKDDPDATYYTYPIYVLKYGWLQGKTIKLVSVPAPDGYEAAFSGQPVLSAKGSYKTNYVSCMIPVVKSGEKIRIDQGGNSVNTDIEVVEGRPVVKVKHNGIPLTEGADYSLSDWSWKDELELKITVNGLGRYTGSKEETIYAFEVDDKAAEELTGEKNPFREIEEEDIWYAGDNFTSGKYKYEINYVSDDKTGVVTVTGLAKKYKKTTAVSIPNTVKAKGYTFTVKTVLSKAFKNNRYIKKAVVGKSVKNIGNEAFANCTALTSVKLSGAAAVGKKAFYGCKKLKALSLPGALTTIGDSAFYGCSSLRALNIPKGVKTIGKSAFARCTSLTKVTLSSTVKTIKSKAFYGNKKLKTIKINSRVLKSAGSKCFGGISSKAVFKVPSGKRAGYKKLLKF